MQTKNELTQWQKDKLYHWLKRWDDSEPYRQAIYERTPVEVPYFDGNWFDDGGTWRLLDGELLAFPAVAALPRGAGILEFGVALDNAQYVEQWNIQCHALLNGKTELVRGLPQALLTFPALDLNASANADHDGQWVTLVDTEETVHDLMRRTHGSTLLNLDDMDETSSVPSDELGLLSSKVVDVPRFELGASTMPR